MEFGGSSLAENFSSSIEWIVHTISDNVSCEIKCNVKTEYKGYMFKGNLYSIYNVIGIYIFIGAIIFSHKV